MALSAQELLDRLDPEQRKVACALSGPVCVRAGAGTGKTRAITYRIAYGALSGAFAPQNLLALTFTKKAAGELRERLRDLGVPGAQARTFHSAALSQLGYFWGATVGGPMPRVSDATRPFVREAARRIGLPGDESTISDLNTEISWAKSFLVAPENYELRAAREGRGEIAGVEAGRVAELMEAYEKVKLEKGSMDFSDALLLLVGILLDNPKVGARVRAQYRHLVVDEYQDVSPLQHRLLQLWLGGSKELCVVGDAAQTIYSFAGATSRFLREFPKEFPGATVVELVRDYRSTPQIVNAANAVIGSGNGAGGAVRLVSQLPSSFPVEFREHGDDEAEAKDIARRIGILAREGLPFSEMAILYRVNGQSAVFEGALREASIPYRVAGGVGIFRRKEVREAMASLSMAARSEPSGSLSGNVGAVLRQLGWTQKAPQRAGVQRERWDSLDALHRLAVRTEARREVSLRDFVRDLEGRAGDENPPETDEVTLSTLHAAKGLEWDAVFLAGMHEGLMPLSYATTPDQKEEERRLLYVGITRARQRLVVSYAKSNGKRAQKRSGFLADVWPQAESKRSRATSYRQRARQAKQDFARDYPDDVPLLRSLQEWRRAKAKELGKPAYTIFPDAALRDLAVSRPQTLAQLSRIRGIGQKRVIQWGEDVLEVIARG